MDLLASVRKEGSRGGRADFKWEDVKNDAQRENYLGHSLMAPVGRWQKGKDLNWYARDDGSAGASTEAEKRKEEIRKIKEAEEDARLVALGLPPKHANANLIPVGGDNLQMGESDTKPADQERKAPDRERKRRRHRSRSRQDRKHRHRRHRTESRDDDRHVSRRSRSRDDDAMNRRDYPPPRSRDRDRDVEKRRDQSRSPAPRKYEGDRQSRHEDEKHSRSAHRNDRHHARYSDERRSRSPNRRHQRETRSRSPYRN